MIVHVGVDSALPIGNAVVRADHPIVWGLRSVAWVRALELLASEESGGTRGRRGEGATMNDERGGSGSRGVEAGQGTGRLYNPFADLHGAADLKSLESAYRLPSAPEYLFPDEAAVQRHNWSENLTYYTGCGYGVGAIAGGVMGGVEGLRSQEASDTMKICVNRLLNASGHRGRGMGNMLGILGLLYAGFESTASYYRDADNMLNTVIAGLGTGAVYKAAAGPRTAAIAGALGGFAAAALVAGKQLSKRYLPI